MRFSLQNNEISWRLVVSSKEGRWDDCWIAFKAEGGLFEVLGQGGTATSECLYEPWWQQPAKPDQKRWLSWKQLAQPRCWNSKTADQQFLCSLLFAKFFYFFFIASGWKRKKYKKTVLAQCRASHFLVLKQLSNCCKHCSLQFFILNKRKSELIAHQIGHLYVDPDF